MPQVGEAYVEFRAKTDKLVADLKQGSGAAAGEMAKNLAMSGAAIAVVTKSVDYLKDAWKNAADAAKGERQTEAVLRSTGEAAGVTADHVTNLTKVLQKKSTVDDDVVRSTANVLLRFEHLRNETGKGNDVFDRTTALTLDMAAAMGTDASSAALKLGRALDSPVEGTAALTRMGVRFTAAQKEQIAALVHSGDLLGAQTLMLAEYEKRFGGSAAAQATAADRAKIALENMSESIGTAVIPAVEAAATAVAFLAEGVQALPAPVAAAGVVIVGLGAAAIAASKAVAVVATVTETLGPILGVVTGATARKAAADQVAAVAAAEATVAMEAEAVAATGAGAAMSSAVPVVGVLVAAVAAGIIVWHRAAAAKKEIADAAKVVTENLYGENSALKTGAAAWETYLATQSKFKNAGTQESLLAIGASFEFVHAQLLTGAAGYAEYQRAEMEAFKAGTITFDQLRDLEGAFQKEQKAQERSAEQKLQSAVLSRKLTKEQVDEAVSTAAATDETNAHIVALAALVPEIGAAARESKRLEEETAAVAYDMGYVADNARDATLALAVFNANVAASAYRLSGAGSAMDRFRKATDDGAKSAGGGSAAMKDMVAEADKLAEAEAGVVSAEEDLALAIEKRILIQAGPTANQVAIAEIEARQRIRDVTAATNEAADAATALSEAQASGTAAAISHAALLASMEVAAADRDRQRAVLAVADAQKKLADAQANGTPTDVTNATLDLADARDEVVKRTDAARLASVRLKTAQDLQRDSARAVQEATDRLGGAQDRVTTSAIEAADAQKDLADTQNIGKAGSAELKTATDDVEDAQRKLADAHDAVRKQERDMNEERSGGGGSIATTETLAEKTKNLTDRSQELINDVLANKGTRAELLEDFRLIGAAIDGAAWASPAAKTAMHDWLAGAKFDAELAMYPIEALRATAEAFKTLMDQGYQQSIELGFLEFGGTLPRHAKGGQAHRGLALVGEEGPELVQFGGDAAVFPNDQLISALSDRGGGDTVIVNIGTVTGTRNDAEMVGSVASAHVARTLAGHRARFDLRGNR